jgi:hypothetical protein
MDAPENKNEDLKGLYDLAVPLGMPISVIRELVDNFELDVVRRKAKVDMIGELITDREIVVLRGDLETVLAAKDYMFTALDRKVEEWNDPQTERAKRYKEMYEKRLKEEPHTEPPEVQDNFSAQLDQSPH